MGRSVLCALFLATAVIAGSDFASAVVPSAITAQGKLTDNTGLPLAPGAKSFTFRVYDAASVGNKVWPAGAGEVQSVTTSTEGLWTALVGAMDPLTEGVFSDTVRWLEIEVEGTILPRVRLVTGPFAFRVATVDGASGGTISSKVAIGPGHTNTGADAFVAGNTNAASGDYATAGGGYGHTASGYAATVAGGRDNTASDSYATVGGGRLNSASGFDATVPGGLGNGASGAFSLAAGNQAQAVHNGTFVWSSSDDFTAFSSTGANQFLIQAPGGVGIGTNSPSGALHVAGGNAIFGGNVGIGTNSPGTAFEVRTAGSIQPIIRFGDANGVGNLIAGSGIIAVATGDGLARLVIDQTNGNVGIGSSAPTKALQIGAAGTANSEGMIRLESRSGTGAAQRYWEVGVPETDDDLSGKGYSFVIDDVQWGTDPEMVVHWGSGYVGLGVLEPAYRIDLPNDASVAGQGRANAWVTYSSRRWKTNVRTLNGALEKIQRLRGVEYDHKTDGIHSIGLIAEEVGEVIPEIVQYEENGIDAQSLDYSRLVAVLIEAVKEQQKQIDDLKLRLDHQTP